MSENTGRTTMKVFDLPIGVLVKVDSLIFNCHSCKKIFSPVKATLYPTKFASYYEGVLSRLLFIVEWVAEQKYVNAEVTTIMRTGDMLTKIEEMYVN